MKPDMKKRLFTILLSLLIAPMVALAASTASVPHVDVQLVIPQAQIPQGSTVKAGLYFKLEPGWHVYWINAGDSGEPPHISWTLPQGFTAGELKFPTPKRLPLGPLMDFGYEDEVLFPTTLQVAPTAKLGTDVLKAKVSWLVCREVCIPGKANLDTTVQVIQPALMDLLLNSPDGILFARLEKQLPQPLPTNAKAVYSSTSFQLAVLTGKPEKRAEFFPLDENILANAAPQKAAATKEGVVLTLKLDSGAKAPTRLRGVIVYPDGRAYQVDAIQGIIPPVETATPPLEEILRAIGLAFLGGILLNLMPCVFPVLFLKGLALVNSSAKERKHQQLHGIVYTLGILATFWAVVALLLTLRHGGQALGWGFQFQSPIFVGLLAMLLFFLGLSLAGQFELGLTLTSVGGSLAQKQGYAGSFFTGVLAVVVATPCTAPLMGAAIGFALAQPALIALLVFTSLALGLALPYLLLALNPAWTRLLPRPGVWMETLKQLTAVPIFATVIWLIWVYTQTAGADALIALLSALLILAIVGWVLGRYPARRIPALIAILLIAFAVAVAIYGTHAFSMTASMPDIPLASSQGQSQWQPWSEAKLAETRAQNRPVFVDFTASWCLSCQVNERAILNSDAVQSRFQETNAILLRADWTQHDDAIAKALTELGRNGVPTYALYLPGEEQPRVLPELLTQGIVLDVLSKAASTPTN
jgi:thiol:disulfide interchange protein DsbD